MCILERAKKVKVKCDDENQKTSTVLLKRYGYITKLKMSLSDDRSNTLFTPAAIFLVMAGDSWNVVDVYILLVWVSVGVAFTCV